MLQPAGGSPAAWPPSARRLPLLLDGARGCLLPWCGQQLRIRALVLHGSCGGSQPRRPTVRSPPCRGVWASPTAATRRRTPVPRTPGSRTRARGARRRSGTPTSAPRRPAATAHRTRRSSESGRRSRLSRNEDRTKPGRVKLAGLPGPRSEGDATLSGVREAPSRD